MDIEPYAPTGPRGLKQIGPDEAMRLYDLITSKAIRPLAL